MPDEPRRPLSGPWLLEEHRELRQAVDEVREFLDRRGAGSRSRKLAALLDALHLRLGTHFSVEELGGLFDRIAALEPESTPKAQALLHEHGTLLARARRLRDRAKGPLGAPLAEVRGLLADLQSHEERENLLFLRVVETEVAAQD
jgi:hypothetical protein